MLPVFGYVTYIAKAAIVAAFSLASPQAGSLQHDSKATKARLEQQRCLAAVVYHEARGEPLVAQRAVLDVVSSRAVKARKTFCEIVREPRQFSWVGQKVMPQYGQAQHKLLTEARGQGRQLPEEALWFFSEARPAWARGMTCEAKGRLKFCKKEVARNGRSW